MVEEGAQGAVLEEVDAALAVAFEADQAFVAQPREVARDHGLRGAEQILQLADGLAAAAQVVEQCEPAVVAEGAQERGEIRRVGREPRRGGRRRAGVVACCGGHRGLSLTRVPWGEAAGPVGGRVSRRVR